MHRRNFLLPSWTKWAILVLFLIIIAILIFLTILYSDIQESKTNGFPEAKQRVLQETDVVDIEDTLRYQGDTLYHVIYGKTEENESVIVYVPEDKDEKITIVNQNEIISYDTVKEKWENKCINCELIDIVPAIIKEDALWEITYYDETKRYVLEYVSIFDGTEYEEFRFKKMFD